MNLKTHTAYPEAFIDHQTFEWSLAFLNVSGKIMFKEIGTATDRADAAKKIARLTKTNASDYKREE